MTERLSEDEISIFQEAFSLFDQNNDGLISKNELLHVLKSIGENPTESELDAMMSRVDTDDNGTIDFTEFLTMIVTQTTSDSNTNELRSAFEIFDKNGDGEISNTELSSVMSSLGQNLTSHEINAMIEACDTDGNGKISFEEFKNLMGSK
ncbi:Calcium-binding allergen Ole e 8 [Intoshia linei]|uniref:Calcium-binding allergen Ole e 8 n=1 Tax=Intoshia linei TaxID=1819745 RepID=A0A177ARQ6_9BILA|nr:Calcium-binding allergen Ole e 8 [Intoshia linei]